VREPRPPRKTDRKRRTEAYKAEWIKTRRRLANYRHTRVTPHVRRIRGSEFVRALEIAAEATGDPRFAVALEAARSYRLDDEFKRTAARLHGEAFGNPDEGYLVQVDFFHQRGKLEESGKRRRMGVVEACELIVAEFGLGQSFENEVERLRHIYRKRKPHNR
jgi:hypothetical protein